MIMTTTSAPVSAFDAVGGVAPRRPARTYMRDGRERYADTGRAVNERLGTHILLWIVEDPNAWAAAIEAEADTQLSQWSKNQRYIGEQRRSLAYASAARIREQGPRRTWYSHYHDLLSAEAAVADLRRAHPNPGVRYEIAPIVYAGACPTCHQPTVFADGQVRHHTGHYPAECSIAAEPGLDDGEPEADGFEIAVGSGQMVCGYCQDRVAWPEAILASVRLTGFHLLGTHEPTNTLVVLAEATALSGATVYLPHHCLHIPQEMHRQYAPHAELARDREGADK